MTDHKHGEMDISTHEKVFNGFVKASMRVVIGSILILIFMALVNS